MRGIIPILIFIVTGSCTEVPEAHSVQVLEYFHLVSGSTWKYEVMENVYTPGNVQNITYQRMDSLVGESQERFLIYHYQRDDSQSDWELESISGLEVDNQRVIVTYQNKPVISWVFPPVSGKSWNGFAMTTDPEQLFTMENVGNPFTSSSGLEFDECTRVIQWNNEDYIVELEYSIEVYQKGVGLIEKEERNYIYCQEPSCLGQEIVEEGFDKVISLIEWKLN